MSNQNTNADGEHANQLDEVLNQDQEGEISRPESIQGVGFGNKAYDLALQPQGTSQEHSLDDTHQLQTPSCLEENPLLEAAENAMKRDESDEETLAGGAPFGFGF